MDTENGIDLDKLFLQVADGSKINLHLIYKALLFQSILPRYEYNSFNKVGITLEDVILEAAEMTNKVSLALDKSNERITIKEKD